MPHKGKDLRPQGANKICSLKEQILSSLLVSIKEFIPSEKNSLLLGKPKLCSGQHQEVIKVLYVCKKNYTECCVLPVRTLSQN